MRLACRMVHTLVVKSFHNAADRARKPTNGGRRSSAPRDEQERPQMSPVTASSGPVYYLRAVSGKSGVRLESGDKEEGGVHNGSDIHASHSQRLRSWSRLRIRRIRF